MATASPHISPRAAMIAQDFFRVRVLGPFSRGARGGTPRRKEQREGEPLAGKSSARGNPSQERAARGGTPRKKRGRSIATAYGGACARTRKKVPHSRRPWPGPTVRGRGQRNLFPRATPKNGNSLLKPNGIQLTNKRLGERCGRYPQFGMTFRANRAITDQSASRRRWPGDSSEGAARKVRTL